MAKSHSYVVAFTTNIIYRGADGGLEPLQTVMTMCDEGDPRKILEHAIKTTLDELFERGPRRIESITITPHGRKFWLDPDED